MGPSVAADLEWFRTHLPPAATRRHYEYPDTGDVSLSIRYGPDVTLQSIEASLFGALLDNTVSRRWRIALVIEHSLHHAAKFKHRSSRVKVSQDGATVHSANTGWRRISGAPHVFEAAEEIRSSIMGGYSRKRNADVDARFKSARYMGVQVRLYYTRAPRVPVKID